MIVAIDNDHNNENVYCNDISYDLSIWTPGPRFFLPPNKGSTIVALEIGILFSIGGTTQNHVPTSTVYFLNFQNWFKATSMLSPRHYFGVCSTEGFIYVVICFIICSLKYCIFYYFLKNNNVNVSLIYNDLDRWYRCGW